MDTLPITSPVAAALALADVLGLALPVPDHITVSPWAMDSIYVCAVDMQFRGPDKLDSMYAWAARFGVTVAMPAPGQHFACVYFTQSGVRCGCYADVRPDES
jgi:hypothetical protein